jgi:hypothetical protein
MQRHGNLADGSVIIAAYEQDVKALLRDQAVTCSLEGSALQRCRVLKLPNAGGEGRSAFGKD